MASSAPRRGSPSSPSGRTRSEITRDNRRMSDAERAGAGRLDQHGAGGADQPGATPAQHKSHAPASVACYVLTVSDSRTPETDTGGLAIRQLLEEGGHQVTGHGLVKDEPAQMAAQVRAQLADARTQVIITTGGTGITSRDGTYEAIDGLLEKRLDGFGELFRMISFGEIGSAAMMSRATAGTARGKVVFVLPGSENAVRLAMTRLIIPELAHVVQQVTK